MNELEEKYGKLLNEAIPYYEKGRYYDIPQIQWMLEVAHQICKSEKVDPEIFYPLIILHDIGYAGIPEKNPDFRDIKIKKDHMKVGAEKAKEILQKAGYNPGKIDAITHLISVHDNWVFGDNKPYEESKELAIFSDLDFMFPLIDPEIFKAWETKYHKGTKETLEIFLNDAKLKDRPLACDSTKKIFDNLLINFRKKIA